jgi:glutamate-1-semialdehyde 2,1-aminomutase
MKNNSGLDLWRRALKVMPGGNGLLSKRPDRYAPDIWPTYYRSSHGVSVIDLDGNCYIDMAQMGLGSSILGYSNSELIDSVSDAIRQGVNCTLNAPEEVELAEVLLKLNPFAGGVRFTRSGGEAMAMAVRIARAYSGRSKVAFSGYHGWCDWYLATNLKGDDGLAEHLLPGLSAKGVPPGLAGSAIPFKYNDVADFERVMLQHNDIGVICIEGARYDFPEQSFLEAIFTYSKKRKIVIIYDEITSGWRMTDGGVYKLNGYIPDIVVYGKAMGGGFAISAIVGKKEVMDISQDTFMSSTMWTERVGFVAALKTIEILVREKGWEHLIDIGNLIGEGWIRLARKNNLLINITDFKPLITMKFNYGDRNPLISTLFTQEMLRRGYLAASSVYVSLSHTRAIVETYLENVDQVFSIIQHAITTNSEIAYLETAPKSDAFQRLT